MKSGVIYARYSSENQREQSIEGQMRVCQEYAKNNDILILDTYIDRAMTGTNDNRPSFQKMIADSKKKDWSVILVYKFDRFSRNKYETAIHKKTLKDNGIKLVSATEYLPDTPERIIIESMFEGYAEYYSAELSQKVRRGMRESRLKGNYTGGRVIYGYKVENKKVVIEPDEAEVVRYIFQQYAMGVYVKDIIDDLTSRGILNRGKPFVNNTIYYILQNERYAGIYRYKDEVYNNTYPQIVPTDIYEVVKRKTITNKYGKQSNDTIYLLRNKVKCGYCGSSIAADSGTCRNGETKRYYKCMGRKHRNGCKKEILQKEFLEEFVISNLISFITNSTELDGMTEAILKLQKQLIKENPTLSLLTKDFNKCKSSLNNLLTAVESGVINATTNRRMQELEYRLEELNRQIAIERNKMPVKITRQDIHEFYTQAIRLESKMMIQCLIKEIRLYDDKIEIQFNSPLNKSLDDNSQGFLLYMRYGKIPYYVLNRPMKAIQNLRIELYV